MLINEADRTGKPLGQEIAGRLEASRDFEGAFGGARAAAFFRGMASSVVAAFGDDSWLDDPTRFASVRNHLFHYLVIFGSDLPRGAPLLLLADSALREFKTDRNPEWLDTARDALERHIRMSRENSDEALAKIAEVEALFLGLQPSGSTATAPRIEDVTDPETAAAPPASDASAEKQE
jgi:hypothetical protein